MEEIEEHFKVKKTVKKNVESVIEKGTLKKSVEALAGTARRQATETEIVPTTKMKEEDHRVATEVDKNLPQDQGTNQNKEETLLTLGRRKIKGQETIGQSQMIHKTLQQQTLIDQTDQKMKMTHQKKERNQNIDLEKEVATETEESGHPPNPDKLEAEQTQHLL